VNDIDRGKRRKVPAVDQVVRSVGGVPDRHWSDPRDGVGWMLWLETAGDRPVLAFGSEGNTHKVEVDFGQGLWDLSDKDLQRFLHEAKFSSAELGLPRPERGAARSGDAATHRSRARPRIAGRYLELLGRTDPPRRARALRLRSPH